MLLIVFPKIGLVFRRSDSSIFSPQIRGVFGAEKGAQMRFLVNYVVGVVYFS